MCNKTLGQTIIDGLSELLGAVKNRELHKRFVVRVVRTRPRYKSCKPCRTARQERRSRSV